MMHNELAEHVATYAAERGDAELEQLCDDVLAGLTDESMLLAVVSGDPELQEAVERGRNAGWRSRRGVHDAFERATQAITGRTYAEVAAEIAPDTERESGVATAYEPACPGEDCPMCNGSACNKCGAGCWNNAPTELCEHDVMERHENPAKTAPTTAAAPRSFAAALSSPAFGRLIKEHLDAESARTERSLRWILGDAECEAMRARLDKPPSGAEALLFSSIATPPGIDRLREQVFRIRYNRERRMAVEVDGVSWPVDLGEAG